MDYTYELYKGIPSNDHRFNSTTNFDEAERIIDSSDYVRSAYIKVYNNKDLAADPVRLLGMDARAEWRETLARNAVWKPAISHTITGTSFGAISVGTSSGKLADANLKTAAAVGKPKMSGVPPVALLALGAAMQNGVDKYGKFNWRTTSVTASVFYDAMLRHLLAWYAGEDFADDSEVHHLAHLMAGAAIVLDAEMTNKFNDDRNKVRPVLPEQGWWLKHKRSEVAKKE
jgi:hypothetical protein